MRGKSKRPQSAETRQAQNNLKKLQINDPANRNDKIMSALDKLGQKFVESEADRMTIKKTLDDNFNAQKEIERKFKRTTIQSEKIENRLTEILQENERLRQKIEEEEKKRVRLLKRIERVETMATDAHAALETKALVLLTDRAIAQQTGLPQLEAAGPAPQILDPYDFNAPLLSDQKWWERSLNLRASVAGAAVVAALLLGWGFNAITSSSSNQTAFAIMQDGKLARIDLKTGAIMPVIVDMQKAAATTQGASVALVAGDTTQSEGTAPSVTDSAAETPATISFPETHDVLPLNERIKADDALPKALKDLEKKAFDGVPEAQHDLAALYTAGQGVKQDYLRAATWFREAANANIANAAYNLGVLFHQGLGVKQDMAHALDWYRRAALLGHPEAQYNLGIAYIEGSGARYNPNLAAAFFQQSALNGIVEGAYNLGLILENGLLGQAHLENAMLWYRAAADKGSNEAQLALSALADKLGVATDKAGVLPDGTSLASHMKAMNEIQPSGGGIGSVTLPKLDAMDLALADFIPQRDQIILAEIQGQLSRLSLYPGPQDGLTGPRTTEAIKTYQTIHGLEIDGKASDALLALMLVQATKEYKD